MIPNLKCVFRPKPITDSAGAASLLQRAAEKTRTLRQGGRAYRLDADDAQQLDELVAPAR